MREPDPVTEAIKAAVSRHTKVPPLQFGNGFLRAQEHYAYEVSVSALINLGWEIEDAQHWASITPGCARCRVTACLKQGEGRGRS